MMTQEERMDVTALKRQGWTIRQIADAVGYHPETVSLWLKDGGPNKRQTDPESLVVDGRWAIRVSELLKANPDLLGTSVERLIRAEGFTGSYPTLVRHLRQVRGIRTGRDLEVSMPIETAPGEEFQFDWSDCNVWGRMWGLGELYCFAAILCFSRLRFWWFSDSIDRAHTFEGLVRFFEQIGGVPGIGRTDRMGCLGHSRGKAFRFFAEPMEFAAYHGFAFKACQAGDPKRKGKIEKPFRELKEAFVQELIVTGPPSSINELNAQSANWLGTHIHPRVHRVTKVAPTERFTNEIGLLAPLPRQRYDTARVEPRHVGQAIPLIELDGVFYSVPACLVGQIVEIRVPVDQGTLEVRHRSELIASHRVAPAGSEPVWDPEHRRQAEAAALARHGGPAITMAQMSEPVQQLAVDFAGGDYEVAVPELSLWDLDVEVCGCGRSS